MKVKTTVLHTPYPLKWLAVKGKILKLLNTGELLSKQEEFLKPDEMQIALNTLDNLLELSSKTDTITWSSNFIPWYIKMHVHIHQNRCMSMFMATLFIIPKNWK